MSKHASELKEKAKFPLVVGETYYATERSSSCGHGHYESPSIHVPDVVVHDGSVVVASDSFFRMPQWHITTFSICES